MDQIWGPLFVLLLTVNGINMIFCFFPFIKCQYLRLFPLEIGQGKKMQIYSSTEASEACA